MATVLKLGPLDQGRPMQLDEFMAGDYHEGYMYELIDGRLYVSPLPNLPEAWVDHWISRKIQRYSEDHADVINAVLAKARVFVPGRRGVTNPEPDVTAYHDFPLDLPLEELRWQDVSPVLVVEVISADDPHKDLIRNVQLYLQVPSIKEYWIIDPRGDANRPRMIVYRRHGKKWRAPIEVAFGETYTTKLLPGFELVLDPRR